MENENNKRRSNCEISKPEAKFIIGFFAGMCSAVFPRLMVFLNLTVDKTDVLSDLKIITFEYTICSIIFSLIVGTVVMILEWRVNCEPGKTFMMALSLPALLAGRFNTNSAISLYKTEQVSIIRELREGIDIPVNQSQVKIKEISKFNKINDNKSFFSFTDFLIKEANAAESKPDQHKLFAFQLQQYVIVLYRANDRESAIKKADELKQAGISEAKPVQAGVNQYIVIFGDHHLPRTDALIKADELRKKYPHLNLELLAVTD